MNENILKELNKRVEESLNNNEIPIGAVIFDKDNNIISSGSNTRQKTANVLGHAEINAILTAEKKIGDWRLDGYSMVVNMEPCDMCSVIIKESRLNHVYYYLHNNGVKNIVDINKSIINDEESNYYRELYKKKLSTYFDNMR